MFDKSAAPTAGFVNQGDANYQHGYRIYANGLPQTEKTALYVVPSQLNNSAQRYGLTYLPGIGVTQSLYQNMPSSGSIGNLAFLTLTLPSDGVQWTDDMPTEWYIKDSEGWQDLGHAVCSFDLGSVFFSGIFYDEGNGIVVRNFLSSDTIVSGDYIMSLNNESKINFEVDNGLLTFSIMIDEGDVSFYITELGIGAEIERDVISSFTTDLSLNILPSFIFAGQLTPVV